MSGSWTKGRDQFIPCETWSVNYEWYWGIAIWSCADTLDFRLRAEKMFCMKILLILRKFNDKTLRRKIFHPGRMYMYTLPPWTKRRETINEMGRNIPGGNFLGGNFLGGFSTGEFDGWKFSGWEFSRGRFPRTRQAI